MSTRCNPFAAPMRWCGLGLAATLLLGCGGQDELKLYSVSGRITYKGEPIPVGEVQLRPDDSQDNSGPGVVCQVENGQYQTPEGRGVVGGPYIAEIWGFEAQPTEAKDPTAPDWGAPLFPPYKTKIKLPAKDAVHNFKVPTNGE